MAELGGKREPCDEPAIENSSHETVKSINPETAAVDGDKEQSFKKAMANLDVKEGELTAGIEGSKDPDLSKEVQISVVGEAKEYVKKFLKTCWENDPRGMLLVGGGVFMCGGVLLAIWGKTTDIESVADIAFNVGSFLAGIGFLTAEVGNKSSEEELREGEKKLRGIAKKLGYDKSDENMQITS